MSWLALFFAIEVGLIPNENFKLYEPPAHTQSNPSFYTQLETRVLILDFFFVGGELQTFIWLDDADINFWPFRTDYGFEAGISIPPIEMGFRHFCLHPRTQHRELISPHAEGSYDQFYIRIEGGKR